METLVARVRGSLVELDPELRDGFDRIKTLERDVSRRVEMSASLAGDGKLELALKEAEEATRALDTLKQVILRDQQQQQQRSSTGSRPDSSANVTQIERHRNADQNDGNTAATSNSQPMTTGVNLFDLSLMVKCNLARQLQNNGQLESALQLYTQLCKMAIDPATTTGSGGGLIGSGSFISSDHHQHSNGNQPSARYNLHRFGLNIGNILFEMKEYQRALKYYRLTLDRLSSLAGTRSLQIKLMNNITIVLMAMNGPLPANRDHEQLPQPLAQRSHTGTLASLSKINDHVTSLQLLLNDNSFESTVNTGAMALATTTSTPATAKQQQATMRKSAFGGGAGSDSHAFKASTSKQVLNSNHHKFGLNLLVCQYQNFDLAAVYSTLRSLVQVDGRGLQYKRVFDFDKLGVQQEDDEPNYNDLDQEPSLDNINNNKSSHVYEQDSNQNPSAYATSGRLSQSLQDRISSSLNEGGAKLATGSDHELSGRSPTNTAELDRQTRVASDAETPDHPNASHLLNPESSRNDSTTMSSERKSATTRAVSPADQFRQVMSVARADELESLISAKEREIHRVLITSCNLAIDLDRRARSELRRRRRQQQPSRAPLEGNRNINKANNSLAVDNQERPAGTRQERGSSGAGGGPASPAYIADRETSALGQCVKLVATSDLYKGLSEDLLANGVSRLLSSSCLGSTTTTTTTTKLLKALYVFERIGLDQQVGAVGATSQQSSATAHVDSSSARSQRVSAHANQSQANSTITTTNTQVPDCKSALVATNLALLYLLRKQIDISLRLNRRALRLDKLNAESLANMAYCQVKLNKLDRAEHYYGLASEVRPDFWLAHFNRMFTSLKLKRHPDDVDDLTRSLASQSQPHELNNSYNAASRKCGGVSFSRLKMTLARLQLALLYRQSGMTQRSSGILNELLADEAGLVQTPELFLLASKCLPAELQDTAGNPKDNNFKKRPRSSPISSLQQALALHPYHIPIAERLIALHINDFDYQRAICVLADCVRNRPDQVKWYQMLAECHRRGANYNEAIRIYKHTIELFPLNESCVKALAKLADELGLNEERVACQTRLHHLSQARDDAGSLL